MKKLKCRLVDYHPLLKIAPIKEELVFDRPPIWLYHDVITEEQIDRIKYLAGPKVNPSTNRFLFTYIILSIKLYFGKKKLKRAIVRSPITGKYETADYRISKRLKS